LDDGLSHGQRSDWHERESHLLPSDDFEQTLRPMARGLQPGTPGRLRRQHSIGSACIEEECDGLRVIEHGLHQDMVVDHFRRHGAKYSSNGRGCEGRRRVWRVLGDKLQPTLRVIKAQRKVLQKVAPQESINERGMRECGTYPHLQILYNSLSHCQGG